jgi:short-subunit dehydrogenase
MITGPTSGIGLAFAHALADDGYDLVLVSRDQARLEEIAAELALLHRAHSEVIPADLADPADTRRVEARLREGGVDLLINNAGFGLQSPFDESDLDEEERGLDVMVRAVMRLTYAALGDMLARGSGDIINVASVAGFLPRGSYGAHKAWVISFTTWAGVRYRPKGLRIMALCPGFVHTEFHRRMDATMSGTPSFMWLNAEDVVREALADLRRGRTLSVPSRRYKILTALARITPRRPLERITRPRR